MRTWNLDAAGAGRWILAADARLPGVDYTDDQIWELNPGQGEPAVLALETTYGLRAAGMRIFPVLTAGADHAADPAKFHSPPRVRIVLPNYLQLDCQPLPGLHLLVEYWARDSHTVLGRFTLTNEREAPLPVDLRLNALLSPGQDGEPFSVTQIDGVHVLAGRAGDLQPIIFLEGGARTPPSAYPALGLSATLGSGRSRSWTWSHAAEKQQRASFDRSRQMAGVSWDAHIARLKLLNADLLDIRTGDNQRDAALWLSQIAALQAFTGPTRRNSQPGMLGRRTTRDGCSSTGNGSEYDGAWGGLDASLVHFIGRQLLHAGPELVAGEIRNRLRAVLDDGTLDGRPGPGGQRSGWRSMPLLADLTWRVYRRTGDRELLQLAYPVLLDAYRRWFAPDADRDQDGRPEWDCLPQTGYSAWPAFVGWQRWGQGLELARVERPDLAAYLYAEGAALESMAGELGGLKEGEELRQRQAELRQSLEPGWSEQAACFLTLDRDLDEPLGGVRLGRGKGEFKLELERSLDSPGRVLVRVFGQESRAGELKVRIRGKGRTKRKMVEEIDSRGFQWYWKMGCATAEKMATAPERIEVQGVDESFTTELWLADTTRQDVAALLPLWPGMIPMERAARLIEGALLDPRRFWRSFGVPTVSGRDSAYHPEREGSPGGIWMFANSLLGSGLLRYGYREQAADLADRLLEAVVGRLQSEHEFGTYYHPDDADQPLGDDMAFEGLAPLDLFLTALGLTLDSPTRLRVAPPNPFPYPVSVHWRGLMVEFRDTEVRVEFPDGGSVTVTGDEPRWIEQP